MNVYRDANGVWVATQALAGNKDVIEIPTTSKSDMLEWLNENSSLLGPHNADTDASDSDNGPRSSPDADLGKCPKCKLTKAGAEKLAQGMTINAISKVIETKNGWELMRLMEAVIDRCVELKPNEVPVSD